jgi:light-harvesting complex I chlorophyll a/b binding protein 1
MGRMARSSGLKMSVFPENPTDLPGDLAPTGFFDPLGLSNGKDEATLKQWRDAELKHGRVCMLASVGLLTQELLINPLGIDGPAIRHFDLVGEKFPEFGAIFLLLCSFIEGWTIKNKYETREEIKDAGRQARLRDDVEPGDLSWDPLEWYPEDPAEQAIIRTKELQNGRLAMLAVAGIVAQELADGKEVLCHFQKVCV